MTVVVIQARGEWWVHRHMAGRCHPSVCWSPDGFQELPRGQEVLRLVPRPSTVLDALALPTAQPQASSHVATSHVVITLALPPWKAFSNWCGPCRGVAPESTCSGREAPGAVLPTKAASSLRTGPQLGLLCPREARKLSDVSLQRGFAAHHPKYT